MKTNLLTRLMSFVLIIAGLFQPVHAAAQPLTRAQMTNVQTLRSIVRAFELEEEAETTLLMFLIGRCSFDKVKAWEFPRTEEFRSKVVLPLERGLARYGSDSLKERVATLKENFRHTNHMLKTRIDPLRFDAQYKEGLAYLSDLILKIYLSNNYLPEKYVPFFKRFMKERVRPSYIPSKSGEGLSGWFSKRALGTTAVITTALGAVLYAGWKVWGDDIRNILALVRKVQNPDEIKATVAGTLDEVKRKEYEKLSPWAQWFARQAGYKPAATPAATAPGATADTAAKPDASAPAQAPGWGARFSAWWNGSSAPAAAEEEGTPAPAPAAARTDADAQHDDAASVGAGDETDDEEDAKPAPRVIGTRADGSPAVMTGGGLDEMEAQRARFEAERAAEAATTTSGGFWSYFANVAWW